MVFWWFLNLAELFVFDLCSLFLLLLLSALPSTDPGGHPEWPAEAFSASPISENGTLTRHVAGKMKGRWGGGGIHPLICFTKLVEGEIRVDCTYQQKLLSLETTTITQKLAEQQNIQIKYNQPYYFQSPNSGQRNLDVRPGPWVRDQDGVRDGDGPCERQGHDPNYATWIVEDFFFSDFHM